MQDSQPPLGQRREDQVPQQGGSSVSGAVVDDEYLKGRQGSALGRALRKKAVQGGFKGVFGVVGGQQNCDQRLGHAGSSRKQATHP